MGIKYYFSDIDRFLQEAMEELKEEVASIGADAVEYAVENGSYQNRTGLLRSSNKFEVDDNGQLTLYNDAKSEQGYHYASNVESKGYDVISGAALYAQKRLREEIG